MKETQRKQVPWEHSALTGQFYFSGASPSAPAAPLSPSQPDRSELARAWALLKYADDPAQLEAFIGHFGDSVYAPVARARLEELRKKAAAIAPPLSSAAPSSAIPRSHSPTSQF